MPYKHNEPRRHKIPKAKYKVSNWWEYDQALRQRGSLTVWVTPEALEAWAPVKTGQRGRPTSYSDIVIETAVMLRLAMGKPWRQTEGMLSSIIRMLGLDLPVPDHTTLSRRSARLSVTTTLKKPKGPATPHSARPIPSRYTGNGRRGERVLVNEVHCMDEERRSLAELHILKGRACT
jgi:hypothetical protein